MKFQTFIFREKNKLLNHLFIFGYFMYILCFFVNKETEIKWYF